MASPRRYFNSDLNEFNKFPCLKVLDLFCCSGIGAEGYLIKGARVFGIDNKQPSFYPDYFLLKDVLNIRPVFLKQFDFVHASVPCHGWSCTNGLSDTDKNRDLELLNKVRDLIKISQMPGIIENVVQAPIAADFVLCGSMFGLAVHRHRKFEAVNWQPLYSPIFCNHPGKKLRAHTVAGSFKGSKHLAAESLGCYASRTRWELCQGIPPAYTSFIFQVWLNQRDSIETNVNKCAALSNS